MEIILAVVIAMKLLSLLDAVLINQANIMLLSAGGAFLQHVAVEEEMEAFEGHEAALFLSPEVESRALYRLLERNMRGSQLPGAFPSCQDFLPYDVLGLK